MDGFIKLCLSTYCQLLVIKSASQVCQMGWSGPHQGFEAHVERYRNSPVMHKSALDKNGELVRVVHLNSFMILIEPHCPLIGLIP